MLLQSQDLQFLNTRSALTLTVNKICVQDHAVKPESPLLDLQSIDFCVDMDNRKYDRQGTPMLRFAKVADLRKVDELASFGPMTEEQSLRNRPRGTNLYQRDCSEPSTCCSQAHNMGCELHICMQSSRAPAVQQQSMQSCSRLALQRFDITLQRKQ